MIKVLQARLRTLLLLSMSGLLITCSSLIDKDEYDIEGITATSSMVLPLAHGEMSLNDFLNDSDSSFLKVYPDGLLYLLYEQELKTQVISDLFEFPDQAFNKNVPLPATTYVGNSSEENLAPPFNDNLSFNFNPEKLDELIFRQGVVSITATILPSTPANLSYQVLVELPDMKLNGVPFSRRVKNNASFSLSGYDAVFNSNVTPIRITVIKEPHTSNVVIPPGYSIQVSLSFTNIEYQFIAGLFGNQVATLPDESLKLTVFENSLDNAGFSLAAPIATFEVTNEYGIPAAATFSILEARKSDGSKLQIKINPVNPVAVEYPKVLRQTATTLVSVTNTNELLNFRPEEFFYRMNIAINPAPGPVNPPTPQNFAFDNNALSVKLRVEVPLYGKAKDIVLSDTFDIDLEDVEQSEIVSAFLKSNIINELPLDANIQFYLATDNMVIIDSLLSPENTKIIKGSTVKANGDLDTPGVFDEEIPILKNKIDKLFDASNIILKVTLNTTKNSDGTSPNVKFKTGYKMNVKLGLKANIKLNADL